MRNNAMHTPTIQPAAPSEPTELAELLAELRGYVVRELDEIDFDEEVTQLRHEVPRG